MAVTGFKIEYSDSCITLWFRKGIVYQGSSWEDVKEEIKGIMEYLEGEI